MSGATRVRRAEPADRDTLLRFHRSLYERHRDAVVPASDLPLIDYRDYARVLSDDLRALMNDQNARVLIAERNGAAVGYITGRIAIESRRVLPKRGIVEDWYVEDGARGSGIGAELLRALERQFADEGCQLVESATWSANEEARRAHDALGFREIRIMYRKPIGD